MQKIKNWLKNKNANSHRLKINISLFLFFFVIIGIRIYSFNPQVAIGAGEEFYSTDQGFGSFHVFPNLPNNPTDLSQTGNGESIIWGNLTYDVTPNLTFTLSHPDSGDVQVKYHIQLVEATTSNVVVDYTSATSSQGQYTFTIAQPAGTGVYTVGADYNCVNADYYWRVKTIDQYGLESDWTYGNASNTPGQISFAVSTTPTAHSVDQGFGSFSANQIVGNLIINLDPSLVAVLSSTSSVNVSTERQFGIKNVRIKKDSERIMEGNLNFSAGDIDATKFVADVSLADKKAFAYIPDNNPQYGSSHTLYISKGVYDVALRICHGAQLLTGIHPGCPNEEIRNESDPNVSVVIIDTKTYWKVDNVIGAGGQSLKGNFITNLPVSLTAVLSSNDSVDVKIEPQVVPQNVLFKKGSEVIFEINLDFGADNVDASNLLADTSWADKKAFAHIPANNAQYESSYTLYIPKGVNDTTVRICHGAQALTGVYAGCPDEDIKDSSDPDVSVVTINGKTYWKVNNITGTGGQSITTKLVGAKDILSTTKASGSGVAISGYTQSVQKVTDDFIIVSGTNDVICMDTDGAPSFNASCTGAGNVKANLITGGELTSGAHYTGDQVASAIATALAAVDSDADDSYTVTYAETDDLFSVRADGGNTLNPAIGWATYTGPDSASATLGYTADDSAIRDAVATSDTAVAFNVITGINDAFSISVDQYTAMPVTIDAGVYTGVDLATEMDTKIDALAGAPSMPDVTVIYNNDKFKITSNKTGTDSAIVITEGTNDFLRTVRLNGDVPVDGIKATGIVSSDHTITFITVEDTTAGDKIVITFPTGFGLAGIDFEDVDLSINGADVALATTTSGATWGVAVSGQVLALTSGAGIIETNSIVVIRIGRNAIYGVNGTEQISNPTTVGLYQIIVELKTNSTINQDTTIGVYITLDDAVIVRATIDPILSFAIQGGNVLDFGALEPNAYHKLGGARSAYGYIDLTGVIVNAERDTQTITVHNKVYELSNDGTALTNNIPVMIVDNENNYLTINQVADNFYRAINNNDGDLVRANINANILSKVNVIAIEPGIAGNDYVLVTAVNNAVVSGSTFTDGILGYNNKAVSVDYATGSDVDNSHTGTNLLITTNSANGYAITIQNTDTGVATDGLTNGTTNISAWGNNTYGYGILASAQSARYGNGTDPIITSVFRGGGADNLPGVMNATASTLASYASAVANDNISIEYNIRIDASQPAGAYFDTVTYITTAKY